MIFNQYFTNFTENIAEGLKKQILEKTMCCGRFQMFLTCLSLWYSLDFLHDKVYEEQFFCHSLTKRCNGKGSCSTVNFFVGENNVLWKNCTSVTTDEVAALNRIKKGSKDKIIARVKFINWITHRQASAANKLQTKAHNVLYCYQCINVANFIKNKTFQ